jgi:hypothetical protein
VKQGKDERQDTQYLMKLEIEFRYAQHERRDQ